MARETSNKRRKLNTNTSNALETAHIPEQAKPATRQHAGSATVTRARAPNKRSASRTPVKGREEETGRSRTTNDEPVQQLRSSAGLEDEIVVRSSSRARRASAKAQLEKAATQTPKRTPISKSKPPPVIINADDTDTIEVISVGKQRNLTGKRASKTGKENVSPAAGKESSAEDLPQEIHVAPAPIVQKNSRSVEKRKRQSRPPVDLPNAAAEVNVRGLADVQVAPSDLRGIQHEIMGRLTGRKPPRLVDLEAEYAKVDDVVRHTVEHNESNSLLLIGSRGSGKSALLNSVLSAQTSEFHTVRLNGFIHTDDKLALRETCRQLGQADAQSYADNLIVLLALLSQTDQKSVVFVLDEFDLFTTHPRQTLLYNLFDIAQSKKAPIAVIGLTTRVDIVEALEKRVKSRFSHRYVHLSFPKSLATFTNICKSIVTADLGASPVASIWVEAMQQLCEHDALVKHLRRIYFRTKSISDFKAKMLMPLATLPANRTLTAAEILEHFMHTLPASVSQGPDSKLDVLSSLSTLQLALLICAARQFAIYSTENVSFNLIYEEYKSITGKSKLQASATGIIGRVWSKETAKGAWEDLIDVDLIMQDGRGCKVDVALQEIADSGVDLGQWAKWCKEI